MPAAVSKKRRRDRPSFFAVAAPISLTRASTSFCRALCGGGKYSSLDTICVGTGAAKVVVSAGRNFASSASLRNFMASSG